MAWRLRQWPAFETPAAPSEWLTVGKKRGQVSQPLQSWARQLNKCREEGKGNEKVAPKELSPRKKVGAVGEEALGDGEQSVCVITQADEFLFSDGFKRAALKETFLSAKIIFLKLLGKWSPGSGQVFQAQNYLGS